MGKARVETDGFGWGCGIMQDECNQAEVLTSTLMVQDQFEKFVLDMEFVNRDPKLLFIARRVESELAALYQEIGRVE